MNLITILLFAVAALTILTGLSVLIGTTKQSRTSGIWFFIATLGAAVWSVTIAEFLILPETSESIAPFLTAGIIAGITLTDVALLGYTSWNNGAKGKILTGIFAILGAGMVGALLYEPSLFFSGVTFSPNFNQIHTVHSWYFYTVIAYFTLISLFFTSALAETAKHIKNKGAKNGLKIFRAALSVGGILALVFDLILLSSHPHFAWIGPMAVSISIIGFYYSVVKYHILALSGDSIRLLSYIILIAAGVIVYVLVFYTVFTALFKIPNPSTEILLLNLIMVLIAICLMPALSEVSSMIKALLPTKQIDVGYIVKKLNLLNKQNVDIKELASFLATQLKLDYVGIMLNGRLVGSKNLDASSDDLVKIEKLPAPKHGVFQDFSKDQTEEDEVTRVAALFDRKGKIFGQVLLGRPLNRHLLDRRDLAEIEMIINLVSIIIDGDHA
ncbi:hypothetical protein IJ380_01630 [Candidatus Saccharibacteria bacterium]|nr:hypothetical protein [Candidatus Saccharibacteria bacterium]